MEPATATAIAGGIVTGLSIASGVIQTTAEIASNKEVQKQAIGCWTKLTNLFKKKPKQDFRIGV